MNHFLIFILFIGIYVFLIGVHCETGEPKPAVSYETAKGLLEGSDGHYILDIRFGPRKENIKANRLGIEAFITHHVIFKDRGVENKARELVGKFVSVDSKTALSGDKSYILVEVIVEDK